jgi:hypothetical protein
MTIEAVWKNLVARCLKYGRMAPEEQCAYKVNVVDCVHGGWRGASVFADAQRNVGMLLSCHSLAQVSDKIPSRVSGRCGLEIPYRALAGSAHPSKTAFGRLTNILWRRNCGFLIRLQEPRESELAYHRADGTKWGHGNWEVVS